MLTLARAEGTSWLIASSVAGASIAKTDIDGRDQIRDGIEPVPISSSPSIAPASALICSSGKSIPSDSSLMIPGIATLPSSS